MKETLNYNYLAKRLAEESGYKETDTEKFLKSLIDTINSRLSTRGVVTVKHIGQFVKVDGTNPTVEFYPDREIADSINAPFACFEAIELNDGVTDEMLADNVTADVPAESSETVATADAPVEVEISGTDDVVVEPDEKDVEIETTVSEQVEVRPEIVEASPDIDRNEPEDAALTSQKDVAQEEVIEINDGESDENEVETETETQLEATEVDKTVSAAEGRIDRHPDHGSDDGSDDERSLNPILTFIIGIVTGLLVGGMCGYFIYPLLNKDRDSDVDELETVSIYDILSEVSSEEPTDVDADKDGAAMEVPTDEPETALSETGAVTDGAMDAGNKPEPSVVPNSNSKIITDKVSKSRFLTTMSREYFGRFEFWVYIYEENKEKLGDPNRIAPGTEVVIPPIDKYDIDPNSQASVDKALAKGEEIYRLYRK